MRLSRVTLDVPTARPFRIAVGTETSVRVVVCEVTHEGVTGRGEAAPSGRVTGETRESIDAFLDWAAGEVESLDPSGIPKFLDRVHAEVGGNAGARAALDVALHDLAGKLQGKPAHAFYGIPPGRLETTMTVSLDEPAAMAAEALDYWARGFRCLKLKLGDARRDVERVAAVRRTVPQARLRVDANTGWSREDALALSRKLAEFGLEMIEQPVAPSDEEALVAISQESPVAVYADESVMDVHDVRRLAKRGFRGGFNFKLQKTGGIRPAFVALKEARSRAYGTQLGCNLETGLGITAATHLLSLLDYADLDGNVLLARDPFDGVRPVDGWLETPTRPGIGAEPRLPPR